MESKLRPEIPEEKIIQVRSNSKKIDFSKPFKFIYFDRWFDLLIFPLFILCFIIVTCCGIFFSFRIEGRKNKKILRKRGCITISNHCHYFDTVFASYVLFPKHLYITVAQRNYEVPYIRRILRFLRAFPIPATAMGFKMITEPIGEALRRGHHVHFLPEGELVHLSQTIHRFRSGAFYQSYLHQAPIVPMVYIMKRRRFFGKEMGPNWVKIKLVIGEPIFPPVLNGDKDFPKEDLAEMSEKAASWMEETIANHHKGDND
jgi:1-acyl-sn-glycerol-3-phosphate acyltransferase